MPPLYRSRSLETVEMSETPRVVDCFIFYNELDMLEYRLSILYAHVDAFVLVESTRTFIGNPKPLYYQENQERFAKYADKIMHVVVDDFEDTPTIGFETNTYNNQWGNEMYQRNAISLGIEALNLGERPFEKTDIFVVSDVDEIIDPMRIPLIREYLDKEKHPEIQGAVRFKIDFYYYNLNYKFMNIYVDKQCALTFEHYLGLKWLETPVEKHKQRVRDIQFGIRLSDYGFLPGIVGWHLSYFGSEHFIENKIKQFSHQEYNSVQYTNPEIIKNRMKNGEDLFGRESESQNLKRIEFSDNPYLPPFPEGVEDVWKTFPFCL